LAFIYVNARKIQSTKRILALFSRTLKIYNNYFIQYCPIPDMDQGEPGIDYDEPNLNPLVCDICNKSFDSLDKLGEHQKREHDM
jgi:C2H2-type zinc finger